MTFEIERQITRTLLRYCELLDSGQYDKIASETYAADAVADYYFVILEGRDAIGDYIVTNMARFRETAHAL